MSARAVVPVALVLLTALPVLALCVGQALGLHLGLHRGRRGVRRADAPRAGAWTWSRRAVLVGALAVVGLTPTVASTQAGGARVGIQLWFVVDRTGSMAAEDWGPGDDVVRAPGLDPVPAVQRLDGVRHDVVALTRDVPGAFYSVVAFADEAGTQLPLTDDATAVRAWAQTVTQEVTAGSAGTSRDRALDVLERSLQDAHDRDPGMVRLVFYLSDGEQTTEVDEPGSFTRIAPLVDGGAVLGYGTAQGAPMRVFDGTVDLDAPYIPDPDDPSRPAVSVADETALREVAAELGVPYVHRDGPTSTADLVAGVDVEAITADGRTDLSTRRDLVWPFALLAGVLLAAEAWTWARASSRLRGRR
ncbi:VWA domain-containing protein [Cellulomonas fengjieae]|uniref:VWA domain-containing protein n=1 Tax=Cellulomonas fengjieae TaxID=2819978 RepID=UPI001AAFB709|nr:VWA domain-containing protein [Cellulomonas fengjieae]MBO3102264.1 VWA domain-containing protein [Cellulomonas fengjieae]